MQENLAETDALLEKGRHASDRAEARELRESLRLTPGTLTEVIHHGEYYHRRDTSSESTVSAASLRHFVSESPYVYGVVDLHLARMMSELKRNGETYLGWSRFYLEPPALVG